MNLDGKHVGAAGERGRLDIDADGLLAWLWGERVIADRPVGHIGTTELFAVQVDDGSVVSQQ